MTYQRLCNLVTKGEFNYYSKQFDIVIEPLQSDSQLAYRIAVIKNKIAVETVDLEPNLFSGEWPGGADYLRDKILTTKQELHSKYILL